jgi:hypothetical protein
MMKEEFLEYHVRQIVCAQSLYIVHENLIDFE